MSVNDRESEGARLADALAAEFGREAEKSTPMQSAISAEARVSARKPWLVAAVCLAVMAIQVPALRASLAGKPSLRAGVQESDPQTDACIDTLWAISALIQEGESAAVLARLPLTEPVTAAAYTISTVGDEIVVACPNPHAHGLTHLRITQSEPMPEAGR